MIRSATIAVLCLLLIASPVSLTSDDHTTFGGVEALAAKGGNGKGNSGGNSTANGNGANAPAAAAKNGTPKEPKDKTQLAKNDPLHPHNLGRLNAFFNASSRALKGSSAKSAVGLISQVYAGQVSAYVAALAAATTDLTLDPLASAELQAAALTLATVANKPLSPEIIASVHARLAQEDPALAGLASPTPEQIAADVTGAAAAAAAANEALVGNILAAANSTEGQITGNGLGQIY